MEMIGDAGPWEYQLGFGTAFGLISFFFYFLWQAVEVGQEAAKGEIKVDTSLALLWVTLSVGFASLAILPLAAWLVREMERSQEALLRILSAPATIFCALSLGLLLFWLREKRPFIYGVLEVFASAITITSAVIAVSGSLLAKMVGLLSGIYIMVRGLDNVRKGTPIRFRSLWSFLPKG